MWVPQDKYDGQSITEFYPNVCACQPEYGSAFCSAHSRLVEKKGFPIAIRDFMRECQVDPDNYNRDAKGKVRAVLQSLSKNVAENYTETASQAQGTSHLLRNRQIATRENGQMTDPDEEGKCRKDIGELRRLHSWSRGVEMVVGGEVMISL